MLTDDISAYVRLIASQAKQAANQMRALDSQTKNQVLINLKDVLIEYKQDIFTANEQDIQKAVQNELACALKDRLIISETVFQNILNSLDDVIALSDPIGEISDMNYRPSGIHLGKMRVPLGVIAMIYESRPNVTIEAASLAIKSGNAIILRGGSEAFFSNQVLAKCIQIALVKAGLSNHCVQVLQTTDRSAIDCLITLPEFIDVVIPRGGRGLVERISKHTQIPVIKHLDGNCHTFIDKSADLTMAKNICVNAKTSRYGTCNTMETLLIHADIASGFLHPILMAIKDADPAMSFRVCNNSYTHLTDDLTKLNITLATENDWYEEYLAPILAVKIVDDVNHAISHINHYGSHHTDVIITNDYTNSQKFLKEVDSSSVMINVSSRFADGFEYGLGAEIGISTDKIHARGPVGLHGLTSQKWIVLGQGQIR